MMKGFNSRPQLCNRAEDNFLKMILNVFNFAIKIKVGELKRLLCTALCTGFKSLSFHSFPQPSRTLNQHHLFTRLWITTYLTLVRLNSWAAVDITWSNSAATSTNFLYIFFLLQLTWTSISTNVYGKFFVKQQQSINGVWDK